MDEKTVRSVLGLSFPLVFVFPGVVVAKVTPDEDGIHGKHME